MTRLTSGTSEMTTNGKTNMRFRTPNFPRASAIALGLLCFTALAALPANAASAVPSGGVSKALAELRRMRSERKPTLYEDIERRAAEFLKQLSDPKDQAEIWNELTEFNFNGGGHAKRTIECAKKTLERPIAPEKRVRLYWIWATAETKVDPARDAAAQRRIAVPICLQGAAEFCKLKIPPAAIYPNVPAGSLPPPGVMPRAMVLPADPERARAIVATLDRDCCLGLVAQLYGRPPHAPDGELRALVMEKLNDPKLADEMQRLVEADRKAQLAASHKLVRISGAVASNGKHDLPPPARGRLVLVLSSFLLILTVVLVARRWRSSNRDEQT